MFHSKNWVEENRDELVIGNIPVSNEKKKIPNMLVMMRLIKDLKKKTIVTKETGILIDLYTEDTTNMDEKMDQLKNYI